MDDAQRARVAAIGRAAEGRGDALAVEAARALAGEHRMHTVVLVEGVSDRVAIDTLAARQGRALQDEGVSVVAMGGATSIGRFLELFGPHGLAVRVTGMCDVGEEGAYRRALARNGLGADLDRAAMAALGFVVCDADLEDELIRALGVDAVEAVVAAQGDHSSWRTLQRQPAQQGVLRERQMRRFLGTRSGRKEHYARVLVEALDLDRVPAPLATLLDIVSTAPDA